MWFRNPSNFLFLPVDLSFASILTTTPTMLPAKSSLQRIVILWVIKSQVESFQLIDHCLWQISINLRKTLSNIYFLNLLYNKEKEPWPFERSRKEK